MRYLVTDITVKQQLHSFIDAFQDSAAIHTTNNISLCITIPVDTLLLATQQQSYMYMYISDSSYVCTTFNG